MMKLAVENLAKRFGARTIFENISFTLEPGQALAVVGPNGSGKTTLLRLVSGLVPPSRGTVSFTRDGRKLEPDYYLNDLALVAPYMNLYAALTARENLRFLARVAGYAIGNKAINDALDRVGLDGRGDDYVGDYSSGMQQRLKYAAAILKDPTVLLVDEPTANLDDHGKKMAFDLIKSYRPDTIMIIATNEKEEATLAGEICRLGE